VPYVTSPLFSGQPAPVTLETLKADCETKPDTEGGAVTASDWLTEPDEPDEPIIHGLIDAGDRVALVGQSKARKSFFALQLAVAIATGELFLGYETDRRRVLLFNGEVRRGAYKKRLRRMLERLGIDQGRLTDLLIMNKSEDPKAATFETILEEAKIRKADVVIADPAYLLIDGDESDQTAVKAAVRAMKQFTAEGVTLVMVFHSTKGLVGDRQVIDRVAGSGIFARDCSTLVSLVEHAEIADHAVMTAITRNYPPADPSTIRFDEGAFFVAKGVAAVERTSRTRTRRVVTDDEIRTAFAGAGPLTYTQAVDTVRGRCAIGVNSAKEVIGRAVQNGLLSPTPRGRAVVYELKT
jgi:hypothetical protein